MIPDPHEHPAPKPSAREPFDRFAAVGRDNLSARLGIDVRDLAPHARAQLTRTIDAIVQTFDVDGEKALELWARSVKGLGA